LRHYELVTILSPILNQEQASEAWGRIKEFITSRNGEIVREQTWGTRRLAYPIRKGSFNFLEGSYHLTRFSAEKPFNQELETFLRLDERVLRSLVIATEAPAPVPAAPAATAAEPEAEAEPAAAPASEAPPVAEAEERRAEVEAPVEAMAVAESEIEEAAEERTIVEEEAAVEAAAPEEPVAQAESAEAEPEAEEERPPA
jgi:small subunit ribosomal protein S6